MSENSCVNTLIFDVAATAGLYSQLAGVLAGFAFAALVVILTSRLTADHGLLVSSQTTHTLVCCFVGLVLVSLAYSVLAGESANAGRVAMVELVAAPGFIAAGMLLLLVIRALLRIAATGDGATISPAHDSVRLMKTLLAHVAPLILTASLYGGVADYSDARWGHDEFRTVDLAIVAATALVIIVPLVAYAPWLRSRGNPRRRDGEVFAYVAIGLATAAAAGTFLVSASLDQCETLGQWFVLLLVAAPVLFMLAVSTHLVRSGGGPDAVLSRSELVV